MPFSPANPPTPVLIRPEQADASEEALICFLSGAIDGDGIELGEGGAEIYREG